MIVMYIKKILFTILFVIEKKRIQKKLLNGIYRKQKENHHTSNGLLDESVLSYQEWDTSLILAKNGAMFYHIKEPLFIYNIHSGETISKDMVRDFNGYQYIMNKYKEDIIKYAGIEIWKKHIKIQYKKFVDNVFPLLNQNNYLIVADNARIILNDIELYFLHNDIISKMKKWLKKILISTKIFKILIS